MKHLLFVLLAVLLLSSCQSAQDRRDDIQKLKAEQVQADNALHEAVDARDRALKQLVGVQHKVAEARSELVACSSGHTPKYILKLQLRQIHYSLSLSKQIKDAANAQEFEIPVDKEYYDKFNVGDNIQDNFRMGSLVMHGSFGKWRIKVIGKRIY